jgi:hypothetical protein
MSLDEDFVSVDEQLYANQSTFVGGCHQLTINDKTDKTVKSFQQLFELVAFPQIDQQLYVAHSPSDAQSQRFNHHRHVVDAMECKIQLAS